MKTSGYRPRVLLVVAMLAGVVLTAGCRLLFVGAVAGGAAGAVAYADGKLVDTLGNPYDQVVAATEKAITQLGFAQPEERKDELSDTLTTHTAKGDSVEIVLTNVSGSATKVSIRINTFGDQEMSMAILDKIKGNL